VLAAFKIKLCRRIESTFEAGWGPVRRQSPARRSVGVKVTRRAVPAESHPAGCNRTDGSSRARGQWRS
jgi:hypothetical protein